MSTLPPALRRRFPLLPIGVVIGGLFGLFVALALSAVLAVMGISSYRNTYALLNDKIVLLMDVLDDRVRAHLEPASDMVGMISRYYRQQLFELSDKPAVERVLAGALAGSEGVGALLVFNKDMIGEGLYLAQDGTPYGFSRVEEDANSTLIRAELSQMEPNSTPHWGVPINSYGDSHVVVAASLTRDGHSIDGYVVASIGTTELSDIVRAVAQSQHATAFLLYGDTELLAHSRGESIGLFARTHPGRPTVPLATSGDPVLEGFADREIMSVFKTAAGSGVEVSRVHLGPGQGNALVMTRTLGMFGPEPLIAGIYLDPDLFGSEIRRLYMASLLSLGLVVVSVAASLWLGLMIARPFKRVMVESDHIARLELEKADYLPRSQIREIDISAASFNSMLAALRTFSLYVPRRLVRRLMKLGFADATRSRTRVVTVMFTDIVGFTTLSENMSAAEAAALLNRHFGSIVSCIEENGGLVDKFLGDGLMAVWGAFDDEDNGGHAARALKAATAMVAAVSADCAAARTEGRPVLRTRIGVHSGPAIVGNLGTPDRVNYTIVGDTVNVAARLESLGRTIAPDADAVALVTGETVTLARSCGAEIECQTVGSLSLRGRSAPVEIQLVAEAGDTDRCTLPSA
ncbi:adenylate/guanylate cyclase domain-containing protein [Segnochrobactraceae bacterium EtOH-i3]